MRTSAVAGLIYANSDDKLKKLTANRSLSSVPFGGRYRIVDFALSNLVNMGVTSVGIITRENYRSLMDHVGNGISWDLDRKNGGVYFIPPYYKRGVKRFAGTVAALASSTDYIEKCGADYFVLYESHMVANIDLSDALKEHRRKKADITIICNSRKLPEKAGKKIILDLGKDMRIKKMISAKAEENDNFSIGVTIIGKELLLKLIKEAEDDGLMNFTADVIMQKTAELKIYGYKHNGYVGVMDNTATYFEESMALLKTDVRNRLFDKERPIYTKVRDGMPTRYGVKANAKNCFIGDDCIIEGSVKNSILFRGVKIEKGAVVENCILMQETSVGKNAVLSHVISDKNAVISDGVVLKGTDENLCFINKNQEL